MMRTAIREVDSAYMERLRDELQAIVTTIFCYTWTARNVVQLANMLEYLQVVCCTTVITRMTDYRQSLHVQLDAIALAPFLAATVG